MAVSLASPGRSRTIDLGGLVHFVEHEGPADRTFVLVHGLGGAAINWAAVAPGLATLGRVLALDLPGFGHSSWRPGASTVDRLRETLARFLRAMTGGPVVLVGNSLGGMIAMLQASVEPASVQALVLACPVLLPVPFGSHDRAVTSLFTLTTAPLLGRWLTERHRQRTTPEQATDQMLSLCGLKLDQLDPAVLEAHHALGRERVALDWSIPAYVEASRSLLTRLFSQRRQVAQAIGRVRAPTLLLQGDRDRLVLPAMSAAVARLRPDWHHLVLPGIGHTPMLQEPAAFVSHVARFLTPD